MAPPLVIVNINTDITLSISWTSGGSLVKTYEVMWMRDTLKCRGVDNGVDNGSATISNGSTSYNITELEEDSNYSITVEIMAENVSSNPITGKTDEAREDINNYRGDTIIHKKLLVNTTKSVCISIHDSDLPSSSRLKGYLPTPRS